LISELTDELLTAQAFVFFIAGFETSATMMTWSLYHLSKDRGIQDRVREEIREIKKKNGGITYQAVKEMVYLEACLKGNTFKRNPNPPIHYPTQNHKISSLCHQLYPP
jgi:cytochrome P450 family 6